MGKLRLLWQNLHPEAMLTVSSEAADWPAEFLKVHWPTLVHRTTDIAAEWWKWDLSAAVPIKYFLFWNHNFSPESGLVIKLQANNSDDWSPPALEVEPDWRENYIIHSFIPDQPYQWWRLYVENPGNPDGYLQGGYAYLGGSFRPYWSFRSRPRTPRDPSIVSRSFGGQTSAAVRQSYKELSFEFDGVRDADRIELENIFDEIGIHTPYFILPDEDNLDEVYYVQNIADWDFVPRAFGLWRLTIHVETVR